MNHSRRRPLRVLRAAALVLCFLALHGAPVRAESGVRLPKVFGSHMVLQRDVPVPVWGWAAPKEALTVRLAGASAKATANAAGEWKATLPAHRAGGPHVLSVEGSTTVRFEDVWIGEVWLCSGQSNMEMGIGMAKDAPAEIAAADHPHLRLLMVPNRFAPAPLDDFEGQGAEGEWKVCTPETVARGGWGGFSAAGYFFGREIEKALDVPVGLIDATWGGTRIQPWTPPEGFAAVPALAAEHELVLLADPRTEAHRTRLAKTLEETARWLEDARKAMAAGTPAPPMPTFPPELLPPSDVQSATALWNGMIRPIVPYALRGAIWYQGESNLGDGPLYTERMKALIDGWRTTWGQGPFPFYFVQVAPYNYGGNPQLLPLLWEAQEATLITPYTGMAVTNDIGNTADIHPTNKQEVGRRLALLALAGPYGKKVVARGPTVRSTKAEGAKLRVVFDDVAGGLSSRDGKPLTWFEVIDADEGGYVKAKAQIDGSSVVLTAPEAKHPVAVRFAWHMLAEPNLVNSEGLPAGAFRAGSAPDRDPLTRFVPEAKDYTLVYALDLAKLGPQIVYDTDASAKVTRPFDRIAYVLELEDANGDARFVYVSMDAFTKDLGRIGVPTAASGAHFQQNVGRMNVVSNVPGIAKGTGLPGGNIELWSENYGPANAADVPNASATTWDFGDAPAGPRDGYGSMQVHDHANKQTLFAINDWKAGAQADVGIGNQPTGNPDWTFAKNAGAWAKKRLRVLVRLR